MQDSFPYPVKRIGIIGGGQLGRLMVMAAHKLGCAVTVLDPHRNSPAGQLAGHEIVGNFDDPVRIRELVESCEVTTYDIESIGTEPLIELVEQGHVILPDPHLLALIQDKLQQKQRFAEAGIPSADFIPMEQPGAEAFRQFGYPLVQKARRGGYDGRGVAVLESEADFDRHLKTPSLLERRIDTDKELAVMVVRATDGEMRCYPVVEMVFDPAQNILDQLLVPARIDAALDRQARQLAMDTVKALDGVGIFGVEFFLDRNGQLLVNEVAPRTHNSGHYTIEACVTDQFEQHLRAILGLPLGSTELLSPAVMLNLLGEPGFSGRPRVCGLSQALAIPGVSIHLYGKAETRPYRKMGHVTILDADLDRAREKARQVSRVLRIEGEEQL
ncbi:MAG: 5-(carboxyamino)imidazole ribonucleotide synthase [Gammaproteobacteria bacterium]|nr:5-(carboxyamino)imidazole ribonucleotide synthase [Pseudomonadales bacterium]